MNDWRSALAEDANTSLMLPQPLEEYVRDRYGVSLEGEYAGIPIRNIFGKASGQLSLTPQQVEHDAKAGLGFVVLKTLIAQDEAGSQSMKAWAIPATHMKVEEITGTRRTNGAPQRVRGERGWTVTWKGRGWSGSLEEYLEFFDRSLEIGSKSRMLVVPSVKYHLPKPGEEEWRVGEYEYTTRKLHEVWRRHHEGPMPIEKDFSPTLAGDESFSRQREQILHWLQEVPRLLRATSVGKDLRIGLKLFNASFTDDFQCEMLRACYDASSAHRADYLVYGNRLFDPHKSYEGVTGVAYGGPDLSDRNLATLRQVNSAPFDRCALPLSGTGNIVTGRIAHEYVRAGATSLQMHTVFQLPDSEYVLRSGSRTARALHRLVLHPEHGYLRSVLSNETSSNETSSNETSSNETSSNETSSNETSSTETSSTEASIAGR